ncbi:MAG TPA: MFS transporter, partial [Candidatus Eisenbacteria bacterium]|nr:MFS transporter [Candidatus Eisenbacteria bacterium]
PTLEALVCEQESRAGLQRMVGIYNLVWASTGAVAYFTGGAMLEKWGLRSLFLVPMAIVILEWLVLYRLQRSSNSLNGPASVSSDEITGLRQPEQRHPSPATAKTFLRMAWLLNPFAYVAINSVIPVIPTLAHRLELTPMFAGFFCSVWLFARTAAFLWLWLWPGWHYRFGWLAGAYLAMGGCFSLILLAPNLWLLLGAQIVFGLALGLIYYSSLFYSMDVGQTKGEHGGLHEAAIGAGNCTGPAIGATALYFFPRHPDSGTWAVSGVLVIGFVALLVLRRRKRAEKLNG